MLYCFGCSMHIPCMMIRLCMLQSYLHSFDIQNLIKVETFSCFKWQYAVVSFRSENHTTDIYLNPVQGQLFYNPFLCIMDFLSGFLIHTFMWNINIYLLLWIVDFDKYISILLINVSIL